MQNVLRELNADLEYPPVKPEDMLNPIPVPQIYDLSKVKFSREHLSQVEPILDLESLALHVALLTVTVKMLNDTIEGMQNDGR